MSRATRCLSARAASDCAHRGGGGGGGLRAAAAGGARPPEFGARPIRTRAGLRELGDRRGAAAAVAPERGERASWALACGGVRGRERACLRAERLVLGAGLGAGAVGAAPAPCRASTGPGGPSPPTSASGLGSPRPHLRRDWATSAPGLQAVLHQLLSSVEADSPAAAALRHVPSVELRGAVCCAVPCHCLMRCSHSALLPLGAVRQALSTRGRPWASASTHVSLCASQLRAAVPELPAAQPRGGDAARAPGPPSPAIRLGPLPLGPRALGPLPLTACPQALLALERFDVRRSCSLEALYGVDGGTDVLGPPTRRAEQLRSKV